MDKDTPTQNDFDVLNREYKEYIEGLKRKWVPKNQVHSKDVFEVMDRFDREKVEQKMKDWERYITPLAEDWWKDRGYGVIWPDDNTKPMQVLLLKDSKEK